MEAIRAGRREGQIMKARRNEEREKRREAAQRRLNDLLDTLTGPAA